ncbi:2-succinyl-6-hydroxy-2,4-cyclohexadiene-1-carboxylate synthase [Lederbergia wuyishanensis]|uniref:Putative 2-succinyl-6-hydroxy-2,4-cyclohexadiene-1-carboxylate synthase n=1 Tax=Lederbergia wuyishanensis TaxID=1347903 RepID=A0ABU0D4T7_9BACI|nr:2-succinyl-6-hydroxy-2,4-cyclohexadiene-1-carboxylate synthase [Lederbergia wuyishanensis]MCJ8009500.1 2-succinyl-6-hydroxy-2,4-cyclohexadiene-1-carboxylate synthase [Lederbergia wuyishanensis]MDQ0343405.1 2-succinyl-6-hydroxy-2,4-cyclohexadiene-1-carboxylate synthase [Lederbergia wuyishanensis]
MIVTVDGIDYYYEVSGNGEPLFLFHGFTGDCSTWNSIKQYLNDSFQVISIDIIGHGKTSSPVDVSKYTMEKVSFQIKTIMNHLSISKAHFLGYSMGGRLALSFAFLYPESVNSLILESASPGLRTDEERRLRVQADERLSQMILQNGIEDFVNYWENISLFETQKRLDKSVLAQIRKQRLSNSSIGLVNSLRGMGTGAQSSWWDALTTLEIPVLLLCGEQDQKFCGISKEMQSLIPNTDLIEVNGVGHAIHVEDPEKFGTIVKEFLCKI